MKETLEFLKRDRKVNQTFMDKLVKVGLERELTSERVATALAERASQGKRTCSEILGYDLNGKDSFKINEKEAEYVRFCFSEYLLRKNLSEVANEANKRGFRGKRGRKPTAWSIQKILTRTQYCGFNTFFGKIYKGNYESIIDVETFNRVSILLKRQGKVTGRKRIEPIVKIDQCDGG